MTTDPRQLAAVHEAGHAVAAVMRGGSTLTSVTLDADRHGEGITWTRHKGWDAAFFTWAGPWAEARYVWGDLPLDAEDDDGCTFADHVLGVFLEQPGDRAEYLAACQAEDAVMAGADVAELRATSENVVWPRELERAWPAVLHVADLLLQGHEVTHQVVAEAVEACS